MKRKSPFLTTPLSFDAPSPGKPCEYLHKPYTARNYVPWATFGSSANFRTVLSESRRRQPISCRARNKILTQNGHSGSFKVIYFGVPVIEEPLMGYIVQYNKCGLRCEGSEDIASERSENLHFRPPHSFDSLQRTPTNIPITLTLLEIGSWATFLSLIVWVYLHSNFSGWLETRV